MNTVFMPPFDFQNFFQNKLKEVAHNGLFSADFNPMVQVADPRFGEFQANGVLPYAKAHHQNPRALATQLVEQLQKDSTLSAEDFDFSVAGPGFINIRISPKCLTKWLESYAKTEDFSSGEQPLSGKTVVVDYSCPNSAKQMHVGHLRSLVIGDAIQRLLHFLGAKIIRDNHIGDWGTQFGILLMQILEDQVHLEDYAPNDALELLEQLYKKGNKACQESETALAKARHYLVELQQGNPEFLALWKKINEISYAAFQELYDLTHVTFDYVLGESFYRNQVGRVYQELLETQIAKEDQGALVVFHPEHPRFAEQPFLIRKSDGASNYASTDLATVLYRVENFHADEIVYVTDGRQQDHFEQLFLTVKKWFEKKGYRLPKLHHVWFGTVCGEDGKAIKTRSGAPIRLKQLFDEAIQRAYAIVREKNPELDEKECRRIAEVIGVGAVKYSDLSQNRTNDYMFSWDKMLSLEGNTAPYLQYAVARIYAIFRKAQLNVQDFQSIQIENLSTPAELELAKKLIQFPVVLQMAANDLRPHFLCTYLYELAGVFSSFYNAEKVLVEDKAIAQKRLMLCARTLIILKSGLEILGIETLEKM